MSITAEQRLKWWNEARFGMFIHWGLYALLAGEWRGKQTKGIGEWIMRDLKIPIEEYEKLAKDFNPVKFDAEQWARLAQDAGMKYLVITAKHHDGFCMFDSPSNPYNIVNKTPFKRDPMKELAAACNKRGIRMCFYYSQALDWHAPGGAGHWEEQGDSKEWMGYTRPAEDFQKYLDDVVYPNVRELLTNYGPIGLIWFDVPMVITRQQSEKLRDFVHELQPECLVSGRVGHDVGDYGSLGDNEHPVGKLQGAWETPATLNDTWGFKKNDHNWKSLDYLLELLVNCASKGVNYLLNVGPTAEGVIPQPSVELLRQVGEWLKRNGQAIYGTVASPFFTDPSWGRVTCKGDRMYLLVKRWPSDALTMYGLRNKILSAKVLGAPDAKVGITQEGDTTKLKLPAKAPEAIVSVIELKLDAAPDAEQLIIQEGATALSFPTMLGQVTGKIKLNQSRGTDGWNDTADRIDWKFRVKTPGEYQVHAMTRANREHPEWSGNHDLRVTVGDQTVVAAVGVKDLQSPNEGKIFRVVDSPMGKIRFDKAGEYHLRVAAERIDTTAKNGLKLLEIDLTPVK